MTLEEAVQSIKNEVFNVEKDVEHAKLHCKDTDVLTKDESVAVYLYTMGKHPLSKLNCHLRAMNSQGLRPWFAYLKLFISALNKLPPFKGRVWRGIPVRTSFNSAEYAVQTWWTVTSTSKDIKIIEAFINNDMGTVYVLETINGRDISQYSATPAEQEVIIMPGARMYLTAEPLQVNNRPFILSFKEW